MAELKDYSGPFNPDIKYEEFSKETLLGMLEVFSKLYLLMDGLWHTGVAQQYGEEVAWKIEDDVWVKLASYEPKEVARVLNVQGDDVASLMKINQWFAGFWHTLYPHRIELKDKNHSVLTCFNCPQLQYFERMGDEAGIIQSCHVVECKVWEMYAHFINPKMQSIPLKLPPRKSPDEIACQFEFKIE
ncbi:DUF6125 family protein [Chloroflexota bacterium]